MISYVSVGQVNASADMSGMCQDFFVALSVFLGPLYTLYHIASKLAVYTQDFSLFGKIAVWL